MYTRSFDSNQNNTENQSIMALILQNLPKESSLTKIDYEGPRIALHTNEPKFLLDNKQILSNIVNLIKRRIVLRMDESIRLTEDETMKIIERRISKDLGFNEMLFDPALGEATVFLKKISPSLIEGETLNDLMSSVGWKLTIRKTPKSLFVFRSINKIIKNSADYRTKFYKRIGEKIFRDKLDQNVESSLISLGGFGEVGRSSMILTTNESRILIDCGLNLYTNDPLAKVPRFDSIGMKLSEIDASLISHAHFDHSGFLPALFKHGYKGPVYCTEPTSYLMYLLFAEYISNNGVNSYYSDREIELVFSHLITLNYGIVTDLAPDLKVTLYNSGHILGSSSLHFHIGNGDHNFVYTGDIKFGKSSYLENAVWSFPRAETLVIEATNGGRDDTFSSREDAIEKLIFKINDAIKNEKYVLIPTQLIGTAQELIVTLDQLIKLKKIEKCKIYANKLISEVNSVHEYNVEYLNKEIQQNIITGNQNPFRSKTLSSKTISHIKNLEPGIIIFPLSMLNCGYFNDNIIKMMNDPENLILFVSKPINNTIGKEIFDGQRRVNMGNYAQDINCKIDYILSLNSHSDFNQLNAYVSRLRPKLRRIIVNHGDRLKVQNFSGYINKVHNVPSQYILNQEAIKLL